jgi:hypothetical protein
LPKRSLRETTNKEGEPTVGKFNKDAAIIAQNATAPAAALAAAIINANPDHVTTTESALALFDQVREHIYNGSLMLAGVESVVEFLDATPARREPAAHGGGGGSRNNGDAGSVAFNMGKHKGKTIAEVHNEAPDYLTWAVENMRNDYMVKQIRAYLNQ